MGKDIDNQTNIQDVSQALTEIEAQLSELATKKAAILQEHEQEIQAQKQKLEKQLSQKIEKREQLDQEIKTLREQLKGLGVKIRAGKGSNHSTNTPLSEFLEKDTRSAKAMSMLLEGQDRKTVIEKTGITAGTLNEMVSKYLARNEIRVLENGQIERI